nr:FUSC family protein [Cryobacterium sp. M91]
MGVSIAQNVAGALAAGSLALVAGVEHPYWAVVSVVAVLPPPGAKHSVSRAFHRMIGTTLGVVVTALVLLPARRSPCSFWSLRSVSSVPRF